MISKMGWDMLYKCLLLGKKIMGYGDFKQLKPVNSDKCDKPLFLNMMFNKIVFNKSNYRNNFSNEYYDTLINSKSRNYLIEQVKKYSVEKYENADYLICYRNNTRNKYNKLMMEKNGFSSMTDIGLEVICKTNDFKEDNIYNNFTFIIVDNSDGKIKLINKDDIEYYKKYIEKIECPISLQKTNKNIYKTECNHLFSKSLIEWLKNNENCPLCRHSIKMYEIPIDDFLKKNKEEQFINFDISYCRTIYNLQGQTIKSYYYCDEDKFFLENETAYTIISRLKQDLNQ